MREIETVGQSSPVQDTLGAAAFSYERWRESFLKLILRGSCVLSLAYLAFSIFDTVRNGQILLVVIYCSAWTLLVVITFSPLPYWLRTGAFLFILYAMGASGLIETGIRGDARLFFVTTSVMAALLVEPVAGMAVLGFCLLSIAGFAPFAITGRIHLLSKVTVAGNVDLWVLSSLELLALGMGVLIGLNLLLRDFRAAQKRVADVVRDLTREHTLLRESEARFRLLAENSTDVISRHSPEGVFRYASPACKTLLGYEPEELVGISAYDLVHPHDVQSAIFSDIAIQDPATPRAASYRIKSRDGRYTWFETISRAIRDERTGHVIEIQCASRDISERKRAQQREQEHEQQMFQTAKLASLGTLVSGIAHEINNPNSYIRLNSQNLKEIWTEIRGLLDAEAASRDDGLVLHGVPYETLRTLVEDMLRALARDLRGSKSLFSISEISRGAAWEVSMSGLI